MIAKSVTEKMKKIQVLMSTYNGANYLKQQLDSILCQEDVEVHCLIRDDGSTDDTLSILEEYKTAYSNIDLIVGDNLGYKASFMELLYCSSAEYDYFAFADQDDIWLKDKLSVAINKLSASESSSSMYFSNCTLVDENMKEFGMLHRDRRFIPSTHNQSIVLGFAHGCTMVFGQVARDLILKHRLKNNLAHDYWIPLVMMYLGQCIYDEDSYILYRQHAANTFGSDDSWWTVIKTKFKNLDVDKNKYSLAAQELLDGYSEDLSLDDFDNLTKISNYRKRGKMSLLFDSRMKRNTLRGTLYLKLMILISHF